MLRTPDSYDSSSALPVKSSTLSTTLGATLADKKRVIPAVLPQEITGDPDGRVDVDHPTGEISTGKAKFRIKRTILIEPDMCYSRAFEDLSASALRTLLRCFTYHRSR